MKMTEDGLALIRRFEGFRSTAYRCPAGNWTIGYGHTSQAGPPEVTPGLTVSEAEAQRILAADVERFAHDVHGALRREITPAQFSALVSFAYNVGSGAFRGSSVLRAVNDGRLSEVPRLLMRWVKADGRVLDGLVRRRAAEGDMFSQGGPLPTPRRWQGLLDLILALLRLVTGGGTRA
jgi:lysozyme